MEENSKTEQLMNLDEEQLQAITGGTGGRPSKFFNVPETPGVQTLLDQHQREAQQALSDAENFGIAGKKKKADNAFGEAKMHFDMMTHIYNNITNDNTKKS